ncbi:uncharacterized protein MELLADRAFT_86716 [Melampsora larici-populina 98AG31]|uniref:Uncharacterized protein n=1 Tax=Melampsora larici-populina (strain 98AG31 / pathotype 3-4-7) TaxID=747676 RepID=F4R346_MELLP|nr:uncharacterized protein MELLADRAFT_86716 [Melampsora larici-populina 98AG31]EGG13232.1 hypothetical protein MELLADRAFT_86716 [Melampsora larici-populina 98AG31]
MVKRTLDSAAGTSRDTLEVIVIEDGSDKDECEKDESDKNEKIIVIEDESKNNEEIIIIEDESKKDETKKQTKKGCGKTPQKDVIKSCPLSKPNAPCTLCKTNDTVSQKTLYCHCGSKIVLRKGRVEAAVDHWANDKCKKKTNTICANASLTSWVTTTTVKKNAVTKPCAGLNDDTWKRPTAKLRIENCIKHSPTPYHGVKRWKVCFQLFKTTHEVSLSDEQRKQFHAALESQATWIIKRHGAQESIHSPRCTRTVMTTAKTLYPLCDDCEGLKHDRSLITAINVPYATEDKIKFIAKVFMTGDQFQAVLMKHAELQVLQTSLEKTSKKGDEEFWKAIGVYGKAGLFKDKEVIRGLMMAVGVRAERESNGKSMRGRRFDFYFDNFLTTLAAISPRALRLFNDNFAGRGARSMRQIRKVQGMHLEDGLHANNFKRLATILAELEYSGPVAAATDETVCVKAMRHYNGYLVGAQGGDIPFENGDEIERLVNQDKAKDLAAQNLDFIEKCQEAGIHLLSLGSDGAATELAAQEQLIDSRTRYLTYTNEALEVYIKVPLFGQEARPIVMIQDPKHARKTAANQPLSGARVISLGRFHVDIQQLAVLLEESASPLYKRDVFDSDRQDDGRAYRMFSAKTLKAALNREECTGLAVLKIFSTMASRLLGLIISHRKYYPDVPLMPWKHGTEPIEHVFGWMRVLSPNFTVLDARQMVPKIHAVVKSVMSGIVKISKSEHLHAGYEFAFSDEPNSEHIDRLRYFPTDEEIEYDLNVAKKRAISLAAFVGMHDASIVDTPIVISENQVSEDVSTCMAEKYDVVYKNGPEDPLEEAVTTAAEAIDEQQQTDVLLSAIPEDIDEVIFKNVAMSLSTILNPNEGGSSEARSEGTLSDLAGIDHKLDTLILNNQEGINLEKSKLLQLRVAHDSQVQRHRGNERAKINVDDLRKSPGELLKPSECSKLVAVVMKNAEATPTGLSRIHRWSINVKLNLLQRFQNTSTHLDSSSHADLTGGGITAHNPIEMGKFVVLIKNGKLYLGKTLAVYIYKNKKHAWVKSSKTRNELSYVSVQILLHNPHQPVATVADILTPDVWTFARIEASHIVYVFLPSRSSNFSDLGEGSYSVPAILRRFIISIDTPNFIRAFEAQLKTLKSAQAHDLDD